VDFFAVINFHPATQLSVQKLEIAYTNTAFAKMIQYGTLSTDEAFAKRIYRPQAFNQTNNNQA